MLQKFLEEVVEIVVGKQAEPIVSLIDSVKYVSEFVIAKKLNLTINQTRNILYKISNHGLVSSIRKKDKKKGWYTYFWKIEKVKTLDFLKDTTLTKLDQIDKQINSRESKQFFVCERCKVEFTEENALLNNFICSECGDVFTLKDNSKLIKELKKNKDKLEKKLFLINEELKKELEKEEKEKAKESKKQLKKAGIKAKKDKEERKEKREKLNKLKKIDDKKEKKVNEKKIKKVIEKIKKIKIPKTKKKKVK